MKMNKQQGAALIVSLVILIVMTIIGLASIRTSSMEEKMSANTRDQQIAMQATEIAIRAGEAWIASQTTEPDVTDNGITNVWTANIMMSDENAVDSWWQQRNAAWWNSNGVQTPNAVTFSTNAGNINVTRPRYVIEYIQYVGDDLLVGTGSTTTGRSYYRVTARGTGGSEQARVLLQSTTAKRY